ncbi:hypothetical protein Clacol_003925 [Clathrus columnatus]|uniref:Uncharacterized protein n=1 Tax=Clathrus columnatus TaxID=1419009 RepID=A0AAV5A9M4_9AGAM|nr:hypothetical protein Clacol_003925 [Clathrus columnatus]
MGSPQAIIRPLVVNKRRSLDAIQRRQEPQPACSNANLHETWPRTERRRSRRFSLPIEVIPELNEPQDLKSLLSCSDQDEMISRENILLFSELEKHKSKVYFCSPRDIHSGLSYQLADYLLQKAKELERGAYRALFEAEYLRWQAENNCHAFPLDPSIPAALSLKAEELGLRPRNLSLDSLSTTSLPTQSHGRSSTNLVEKKISSLSRRAQRTESLNMKFLGTTLPSPISALSPSSLPPHCSASPLVSSSHHDLEYEDSELRPILRTGKHTLKKSRSRMMGPRHFDEPRSFFADDTSLLNKKKWFRFKCPFLFLICCSRRKKYRPCRQSMGPF